MFVLYLVNLLTVGKAPRIFSQVRVAILLSNITQVEHNKNSLKSCFFSKVTQVNVTSYYPPLAIRDLWL